MRVRVLGAAAIMAVVGIAAGGAAAYVDGPEPSGSGVAAPVPGSSPDYPTTPAKPTIEPEPDIGYPPLVAPSDFDQRTVGNGFQRWRYPAPSAWQAYCVVDGGAEHAGGTRDRHEQRPGDGRRDRRPRTPRPGG